MPDLAKKLGPFTGKQWVVGGVGGGALFLAYRWWRNRSAGSSTAGVSSALVGGSSIPGDTTTTGAPPGTLAEWEQAAFKFGTSDADTLNAITNWMSGNCVDPAGYNALQGALNGLGLPPGMTTFPVLTVCAGPASGLGSSTPSGGGPTSSTGSGSSSNATGTQGFIPTSILPVTMGPGTVQTPANAPPVNTGGPGVPMGAGGQGAPGFTGAANSALNYFGLTPPAQLNNFVYLYNQNHPGAELVIPAGYAQWWASLGLAPDEGFPQNSTVTNVPANFFAPRTVRTLPNGGHIVSGGGGKPEELPAGYPVPADATAA